MRGVSGGKFADIPNERQPTFSDSINSRVIGSRFQEVNRNSVAYGRLPLGSHVKLEKSGELGPSSPPAIPDHRRYGPNYTTDSWFEQPIEQGVYPESTIPEESGNAAIDDEEWVDLMREAPIDWGSDYNGTPPAGPSSIRMRPRKEPVSAGRRETFPLRNKTPGTGEDGTLPPHLRLQPQQPFVRPLSGINHDDLGAVYGDISQWRSKLKSINAEIADSQGESYNDIADGARIKGWLMVGRGLRFIPGIQLIEGRAKEDIRWDVLQNERGVLDSIVLWSVVVVVTVLLAAACKSSRDMNVPKLMFLQ